MEELRDNPAAFDAVVLFAIAHRFESSDSEPLVSDSEPLVSDSDPFVSTSIGSMVTCSRRGSAGRPTQEEASYNKGKV